MASPAYSTMFFPSFYDAMVASLPPEFEVAESLNFYNHLALTGPHNASTPTVKILDLCTGTGSIPRSIAMAWAAAGRGRNSKALRIIGVDNSKEMLKAASEAWVAIPGVDVEWRFGTLGRRGELDGLEQLDMALISAGSWHHLETRDEQIVAMAEVKKALRVGGFLVMNIFSLEEILDENVGGGGPDVWHLKDGFWKQTLEKKLETMEDGGYIGTETFKVGCERWEADLVCSWTLRAVWWHEIRELCEEVGLVVKEEFRSFRDALDGKSADKDEETGDAGRIFVIQKQS